MDKDFENVVNDSFIEVYGRPPRGSEIHAIFQLIPISLRKEGEMWGWNDTVVREQIHAFIKEDFQ